MAFIKVHAHTVQVFILLLLNPSLTTSQLWVSGQYFQVGKKTRDETCPLSAYVYVTVNMHKLLSDFPEHHISGSVCISSCLMEPPLEGNLKTPRETVSLMDGK